jgi:hypothetical protein
MSSSATGWSFGGGAVRLGEQSLLIQGFLLLIALDWDLAMSGELLTNRADDRLFSRPARVLFYAGYVVRIAAIAAFTAGLGAVHQPAERLHGIGNATDALVIAAIVYLGAPILIAGYLLRQPCRKLVRMRSSEPGADVGHQRLRKVQVVSRGGGAEHLLQHGAVHRVTFKSRIGDRALARTQRRDIACMSLATKSASSSGSRGVPGDHDRPLH